MRKPKNPFLHSFLYFALICCLVLGIIFFFLIRNQENELQTRYMQEKMEGLLSDFELQLENFDKTSGQLSINKKYYYTTLAQEKYNENVLLLDFINYKYSSVLTENIFLYYKNYSNIFHVTGSTISLDVYLAALTTEEKARLKELLDNPGDDVELFSAENNLYILAPFKAERGASASLAILGGVISYEELGWRFEAISGGLNGTLWLCAGEDVLYCNNEQETLDKTARKLITAVSTDRRYFLYYLPQSHYFDLKYSLGQISLIILDVLLILLIASLFANRSYEPLRSIREKYRENGALPKDKQYQSVFEEMEDIIDHALQSNSFSAQQISQIQEMLKQQILRQLLNGSYSPDIQSCLDKLGLSLRGPFYYVVCISFFHEELRDGFLTTLLTELEKLSNAEHQVHIYAVCDNAKKQISAIISLRNRNQEEEMTEYILEVAESYSYQPVIGIGKVYSSIIKVAASWLESVDHLNKSTSSASDREQIPEHDSNALQWLTDSVALGSRREAPAGLENYILQQRDNCRSLLMQRYIFSEFLGEISRLSRINKIELSSHNISLLIAAKDIDSFQEAARETIIELFDNLQTQLQSKKQEEAHQVCRYIKKHFMEYDISIEMVAEKLELSTATVREAVPEITGKMYKDYIIFLRIEYAKKLMQEESLSVAEVCSAVGYSSVSYFIRLFKEATGVTPAKYMKSISQNRP